MMTIPSMDDLVFELDGNAWCCHEVNFTNLQECMAGFGDTQEEAYTEFLQEYLNDDEFNEITNPYFTVK